MGMIEKTDYIETAETEREDIADEFIYVNDDWFRSNHNAFYKQKRTAQKLLDVWVRTERFPEVDGIWILFENKFMEFVNIMKRNNKYKFI